MHSEMLKGPWITFHLLNLQFLYIWTGSVIYPDMQRIIYINLILICIFPGIFSQDKALFRKTFLDAEFFFMTEEYQEALHLYT
jgi:hypothetical protein